MTTKNRYICIEEAQPGMVLGSAMVTVSKGRLGLKFPPGMVLTADSIAQLVAHQAEYLDIAEPDPRSEAERESDRQQAQAQLTEMLKGSDLSSSAVSALLNQLVDYRSGTCLH